MAIDSEQNKTQRNLIILVILVLVVTLGILYFGYSRKEQYGVVLSKDTGSDILKGARELRLDLKLLESERFKNFVPYSKLPTDIETGRDNPFEPYN